ncbi:MAG TPA: pilus assembly protein TadG-related protein [Gaiellaceae bacterium]|nr:pilus assembly protein TadG-related protein [Gaiellaceae bacterium]
MSQLRHARNEDGQSIIIVVVFLVVLLGFCALTIDVGHAYLAQRRLQASVDAAALAGADSLPDTAAAQAGAAQYGNGGDNTPDGVDDVQMTVATKCLTSVPGCTTANAVTVTETGSVKTAFGGLFGIGSFDVNAKATACSPCGSKPLDIMLVLDRTGSMCTTDTGQDDHPECTDMQNARNGMETFLSLMDPKLDEVGLAVLPPAPASNSCTTTGSPYYDDQSAQYVVVPLSNNYATSTGQLVSNSPLVSTINCEQADGTTSYANAIEAAQNELVTNGRPGVQKVIVLLSDGAANTGPSFMPASYRNTPCHQGIASSATAQSSGTIVYAIGYDVGHDVCKSRSGSLESPSISALQALEGIASPAGQGGSPCDSTLTTNYCNQPNAAQLNTIFSKVAQDLLQGTSRLIDNNTS